MSALDVMSVECYEGRVKVSKDDQSVILGPNESVNIMEGKIGPKISFKHTQPIWETGVSKFYNEKLKVVLEEIGRQFDYKIIGGNIDKRFTGSFNHLNPVFAIEAICKPMGLDCKINHDLRTVTVQ